MTITEPLNMNIGNTYKVVISYWDDENEIRKEFTDKLIKRDFDQSKYNDCKKYQGAGRRQIEVPEYYCITYYFENHEPVQSEDIENAVLVKQAIGV